MNDIATHDFLLEIGTEELPPKALLRLSEALGANIAQYLAQVDLSHGAIKLFATPRRLAVIVENLQNQQKDKMVEQRGPYVNVAFNLDGRPTAACLGFAKANGMAVENLERGTDNRGTYVMAKKTKLGEKAEDLLPDVVRKSLKNLPIPRLMRWGDGLAEAFVRPVHWLVMLYGDNVVPMEIFGINSGNKTYGHRFHHPQSLLITSPKQYETLLQQEGHVVADLHTRKQLIMDKANAVVGDCGIVLFSDDLLEEVASLTEWPVALLCNFEQRFLKLPSEVLLLSLKKQQRCFPVVNEKDELQACFIAISNIDSKNPEHVTKGNENVILARFTDAEFFYKSDAQYPLASYFDKLQKTVFQTGLGNMHQKTLRIADQAGYIANLINADVAATLSAAELSKSDLMTSMVGEFPELQGIIGYYYALREGMSETIARALKDQYLPAFANDKLPQTLEGCALAIADRIDTIVGVFSLGNAPTGERDPFALRRATFGILRIIAEQGLNIDLQDLVKRSLRKYLEQVAKFDELLLKNYQTPSAEQGKTLEEVAFIVVNKIMDFIFERQRSLYLEEGITNNMFDAVRMREPLITRPLDFTKRLYAVKYFQDLEEAQTLSAANKRVKNILAGAEKLSEKLEINRKLLKEAAEIELAEKIANITDTVEKYCAATQYQEALKELATLKTSVDSFFSAVMVMVDDNKIRNNRLVLLKKLQNLFYAVADISYLT